MGGDHGQSRRQFLDANSSAFRNHAEGPEGVGDNQIEGAVAAGLDLDQRFRGVRRLGVIEGLQGKLAAAAQSLLGAQGPRAVENPGEDAMIV